MRSSQVASLLLAVGPLCACGGDRGDPDYDTSVAKPACTSEHPKVVFDEGHRERHKSGGTYHPLAQLLKNDGFEVDSIDDPITEKRLAPYRVLVIACAQGGNETNDAPAFTAEECAAVEHWVGGGGGLLLVTDTFPFGSAVESLGKAFGIEMSRGRTADAIQFDRERNDDTELDFDRKNRLLTAHPITDGRSPEERIERVLTFTGQSMRGPHGSVLVLRHGASATTRDAQAHVEGTGGDRKLVVQYGEEKSAEGWGQCVAVLHGQGRVVVLGDAEVLSAQLDGPKKIGMNARGNDDRQFALNILHWLSGMLPGA